MITAFAFATASSMEGYLIEGNLNMVKPVSEAVITESGNMFKQGIEFQIADNLAATDKIVKDLANQRVVVLYKNKHKNAAGGGKYKLFGFDNGLVMETIVNNSYENVGAYILKFSSEEFAPELNPFYTLFATTEALTDAIWTSLQTPA